MFFSEHMHPDDNDEDDDDNIIIINSSSSSSSSYGEGHLSELSDVEPDDTISISSSSSGRGNSIKVQLQPTGLHYSHIPPCKTFVQLCYNYV